MNYYSSVYRSLIEDTNALNSQLAVLVVQLMSYYSAECVKPRWRLTRSIFLRVLSCLLSYDTSSIVPLSAGSLTRWAILGNPNGM